MAKYDYKPGISIEMQYIASLRKVGKAAGHLVETHVNGSKIEREPEMQAALREYSRRLEPWAARQAARMLEQVSNRNKRQFKKQAQEMGTLLKLNLAESGVAETAGALLLEQVGLITSLPLKAGIRAQELALKAVIEGSRADEVAQALMASGRVSASQATTIARTEVARANSAITQARGQAVGAVGYIWRTTMDGAERSSHAKMNGKHFNFKDEPPKLSDGTQGAPGTFPNCRCYMEVFFG